MSTKNFWTALVSLVEFLLAPYAVVSVSCLNNLKLMDFNFKAFWNSVKINKKLENKFGF